jgi:hypothetical protein
MTGRVSTREDFDFMERAGRGASSVVFKARRKADGKVYCVKEIDMSAVVPEEEEQALREVQLLASFERRNSEKSREKFHLLWMLDLTCSTKLTRRPLRHPLLRLFPGRRDFAYCHGVG